jgi:hypothetical protein
MIKFDATSLRLAFHILHHGQPTVGPGSDHKLSAFPWNRLFDGEWRVPLWRGDHVTVKQLVEGFAGYLYLPRLVETKALLDAIGDGLSFVTWEQ